MHRHSIKLLFLTSLILLAAFAASAAQRNVILFVVDDLGKDIGAYGNTVIKTPNLDRLAKEGTVFDYAFCTTASCSASRSVLLTGLHNHANGQFGHEHSFHNFHTQESVLSLPVLLAKSGYRTARIGKYHVQPEEVYRFETVLGGNQGGSRNPVSMVEKCRPLIEAESDRPFFLYFCTSDPHRGGGFANDLPYKPDFFGNGRDYEGVDEVFYEPEEVIVPPYLPDTPECRAELAQYYQSVSRIDQGVGRLISVLKEAGRYEDTLILFLSDNGIAFPGAKTTLYEPGMCLPLIVRSPGAEKRGLRTDAMVSWTDITPTILSFAGADLANLLPDGYRFHGRSFLETLDEEHPAGWDLIHASHTFHEITMYYPMRVIRTRSFKYILNLASGLSYPFASDLWESPTWQSVHRMGEGAIYGPRTVRDFLHRPRHELYRIDRDPLESTNLADNPEYRAELIRLQAGLRGFQEETGDPWVVKYEHE